MTELLSILDRLDNPLVVVGVALIIIWQLLRGGRKMNEIELIATNHTSGLPEMGETLKRIEEKLENMNEGITKLVDRSDGKRRK